MAKKKQKAVAAKSTSAISSKKKKEKPTRTDGFGPLEKANVRKAIRLVWTRSYSKQLVVKRCTGEDGFLHCEKCGHRVPKIEVNHKVTVGDVDEGFLQRLFVPSTEMEGLCKNCHSEITKAERKQGSEKKKATLKVNAIQIGTTVIGVNTEHIDHLIQDPHAELPLYDDGEEYIEFDPDIEAMDLYTHEKVVLQSQRNKNKPQADWNLDDYIGAGETSYSHVEGVSDEENKEMDTFLAECDRQKLLYDRYEPGAHPDQIYKNTDINTYL